MHLVLSQLDRLRQPDADAHRLFLAKALLDSGVEPDAVIAAVEMNVSDIEGLSKYDPDQPRAPAGSGRTGGQWTATGGGAPSAQRTGETAPPTYASKPATPAGNGRSSGAGDGNPGTAPIQPASTTSQHRLSFTTFDGGPNDPAGWSGAFNLDRPTAVGGVVIQRIDTTIRQSGEIPRRDTYWEALAYIPPGATLSGLLVDDGWSPPEDGTHGSETVAATATFYEGLTKSTLPAMFTERPSSEAGKAQVTYENPASALPIPSSTPLVRRVTVRY